MLACSRNDLQVYFWVRTDVVHMSCGMHSYSGQGVFDGGGHLLKHSSTWAVCLSVPDCVTRWDTTWKMSHRVE
jgi:hypothetical protein